MRITIDIPDRLYRLLKRKAANEKRTIKQLIVGSVEYEMNRPEPSRSQRIVLPIIRSKRPGTLELDNDKIFKLIPFP